MSLNIEGNEIRLFFFHVTEIFNNEVIHTLISEFPETEQHCINSIQDKNARIRKLSGRIILKYIASRLGITRPDFLSTTKWGKPIFADPVGFEFSIAHSGNLVICCLSKDSPVGTDLELNRPIDIEMYKNCFDSDEWQFIEKSDAQERAFLKLWVRKEAVVKADGRGMAIDLSSFNCLEDKAHLESDPYFIQDIGLNPEYFCTVACRKKKIVKLTDFNEIFLTEYCNRF